MFLKTGELKKAMKSALKSRGLTIGNINGSYLIYCDRWGVSVGAIYASNKFKAAIMELIGDIPEEWECYRYSISSEKELDQERVFDYPDPYENWKAARDYAVMTPLSLSIWPHDYVVCQKKSDKEFLTVDNVLVKSMISPGELDTFVESMPGRPSILGSGILYFKNETTIYWVRTESCGEKTKNILFPCLGRMDFFEDDWILKEEKRQEKCEEEAEEGQLLY